jgi:hypothetical protein
MRNGVSILAVLGILICVCPSVVTAQASQGTSGAAAMKVPVIGGTRVVSTTFLGDPFINTAAAIGIGYGQSSNIFTPLLEIDGEPVAGVEGELLYAILGFDYRYAPREWMAVWLHLSLAARLGNELQSVLAYGISAFNGFEIGWLLRLYETERHLLSMGIMGRKHSTTFVDLLGWADEVISGEDADLVITSPTLSTVFDLRYAYAVNRVMVLQLLGSGSYGESVDRRAGNEWSYGLGGMMSFDFSSKTDMPVGLALGYKYSTIPEGANDIIENSQSVLAGISYVGRSDFSIGLDLQLQRAPVTGMDEPATFLSAVISTKYFF